MTLITSYKLLNADSLKYKQIINKIYVFRGFTRSLQVNDVKVP